MDIEKIVENAIIKHCKAKNYSEKTTKLMIDLTKKYRNEGTVNENELLNYIKRINKSLPSEDD